MERIKEGFKWLIYGICASLGSVAVVMVILGLAIIIAAVTLAEKVEYI